LLQEFGLRLDAKILAWIIVVLCLLITRYSNPYTFEYVVAGQIAEGINIMFSGFTFKVCKLRAKKRLFTRF
jgi:hypothetical protein